MQRILHILLNDKLLGYACLLFVSVVYVYFILILDGVLDEGDAITHFQISMASWSDPGLFLHHWGKPVFTLLSSPFSQAGFTGLLIFNALCGSLVGYACWRILIRSGIPAAWAVIIPVAFTPVFITSIIAGHTEISFAAVLVTAIWLVFKERPILGALIVSFLPLVRTEGFLIIPCFGLLFLLHRNWRAVLALGAGCALYSLIGWGYYGDLFWIITENPYRGAEGIYGSGNLWHFFDHRQALIGDVLSILFVLGLAGLVTGIIRKQVKLLDHWLLIVLAPLIIFVAFHTYAWYTGSFGSLGMLRVIACIAPLIGLIAMNVMRLYEVVSPNNSAIRATIIGVLVVVLMARVPFSMRQKLNPPKTQIAGMMDEVGNWWESSNYTEGVVFTYHPYLAFEMGIDRYDTTVVKDINWLQHDPPSEKVASGDIIFWDAHFCPNEGGVSLDHLMNDPGLKLLKVFVPKDELIVLGGYEMATYVFVRNSEMGSAEWISDTIASGPQLEMLSNEFMIHGENAEDDPKIYRNALTYEVSELFRWPVCKLRLTYRGTPIEGATLYITQSDEMDSYLYRWRDVSAGIGVLETYLKPPRSETEKIRVYLLDTSATSSPIDEYTLELIHYESN